MSAYNENCAAIGNDYWNHRLFLLHADAKYVDVMERTLYNGLLSGVSLDGKSFFYPNPLESAGQHQRRPWFGVACCPGNMTRFLASVPGYVYAQQGNTLYARLERQWRPGDVVELALPMPVRRVVAHPSVEADEGRVALQRGPIVFAAEWPDHAGGHVRNLLLSDDIKLTTEFRADLLGGVQGVKGSAVALAYDDKGEVNRRPPDLLAIPYYAWANRGAGEMTVWIPSRFDDTGSGECRLPASWRLLYKEGEAWKPVEAAGPYEVAKDRYHKVTFRPVATRALRLEVTLQPQWSAGIQEWRLK
jgi:DUF1680 family protein